MADILTRAVVSRLSELREIAAAIRSVILPTPGGKVTFAAMAMAIAPVLYRVPSPALYRDIRAACRLMGLTTGKAYNQIKVIRGVKLHEPDNRRTVSPRL